jgi:hypothetical protein
MLNPLWLRSKNSYLRLMTSQSGVARPEGTPKGVANAATIVLSRKTAKNRPDRRVSKT